VEVHFEKEGINTLDSSSEMFITIWSSLAQEESHSISTNILWGIQKSMKDGKINIGYKHFLGYEKGEDGEPCIVPEEARIIRWIYGLFLEGKTYRRIADMLTEHGILTPSGKTQWSVSTVVSILSNEKYKGAALLQKTYTVDFLSKTVKKNQGERKQYYIADSHPAIIAPETFDLVQSEMKKRKAHRLQLKSTSPFAAKIICGNCGGFYGSKVWHSKSYQYNVWHCNRKYKDQTFCETPLIREDDLEQAFVEAFNRILGGKDRHIAQFEKFLPLLADTSGLEKKLTEAQDACDAVVGRMRRDMEENARQTQDQGEYKQHFDRMGEEYTAAKQRVAQIQDEILEQKARRERIRRFLNELRQSGELVTEFDERLWHAIVNSVRVNANKSLTFMFRDGSEIPVLLPESK
ncbi:MAG: recombinase family protein, partial [Candidatus Nomurabacteria bacterium]|jgi:hypothetical protein|nr:recombinase family protein [Candidatus Nomurabacteria bacterium]